MTRQPDEFPQEGFQEDLEQVSKSPEVLQALERVDYATDVTHEGSNTEASQPITHESNIRKRISKLEQDYEEEEEEEEHIRAPELSWYAEGKSQKELVAGLVRHHVAKSPEIIKVLETVDRGDFINSFPYTDSPQPIGYGATISAPHMHAMALEELREHLVKGNHALDVGSGTGYLTVCMALLVGVGMVGGGAVAGLDYKSELVAMSIKNVSKHHSNLLLNKDSFSLTQGDAWQGGPLKFAPYHAIHVGAAAEALPIHLINQLEVYPKGKMIIPIAVFDTNKALIQGGKSILISGLKRGSLHQRQVLVSVQKMDIKGEDLRVEYLTDVMYVPLVKVPKIG